MNEQLKARVLEASEATKGLKVYKTRTPGDDGWQYLTARTPAEAREKADGREVAPATREDVYSIAVRALTGKLFV